MTTGTMSRDRVVASVLSLDDAVTRYASTTTRDSFVRKSDDTRRERRRRRALLAAAATMGNSRGSASAFVLKPHERRYDKCAERRRNEESYFVGLAKALKRGGTKERDKMGKGDKERRSK